MFGGFVTVVGCLGLCLFGIGIVEGLVVLVCL